MTHSEGFLVATVVLAGSLLFAPALIQRANAGHGGGGHFGGMGGGHFGGMGGAHLPLPSLSQHGSVRGWAGCTVGFKFRRDETIWSSAVTYKHGLASPELGEARTAQCFRMHENVGGLGTAG